MWRFAWTLQVHLCSCHCAPWLQEFNPDCHMVKLGTMGEYGELSSNRCFGCMLAQLVCWPGALSAAVYEHALQHNGPAN